MAALSRNWYNLALCIWAQGCYTEYDICLLTFTYVKYICQNSTSDRAVRSYFPPALHIFGNGSFIYPDWGRSDTILVAPSLQIFFACRYHAGGMGLDRLLQCLFGTLILRCGQYLLFGCATTVGPGVCHVRL